MPNAAKAARMENTPAPTVSVQSTRENFVISSFIDVPVKNYSSGMKARLGFSIATVVEPDILILDEVLSVGDAKFKKKSEDKILSMFNKGVTVLFVSHSLNQVQRICNKAILLEGGKIVAAGNVKDIAKLYEEKTGV